MAKPIQPTPTLEGKDAENFFIELERVKTKKEKIAIQNELEEADKIFRQLGKHLVERIIQ